MMKKKEQIDSKVFSQKAKLLPKHHPSLTDSEILSLLATT